MLADVRQTLLRTGCQGSEWRRWCASRVLRRTGPVSTGKGLLPVGGRIDATPSTYLHRSAHTPDRGLAGHSEDGARHRSRAPLTSRHRRCRS